MHSHLYFVPDSIIVCIIIKQGILQMTWHTIDHVQPCMTPTQRTKWRGCIFTDSILAALLHLHVHSIIHSLAMLISWTNPIFEGKHASGSARDSLCLLCNATFELEIFNVYNPHDDCIIDDKTSYPSSYDLWSWKFLYKSSFVTSLVWPYPIPQEREC